jgi:spore coat polysaccharide biosynthesis protein SpsF
MAASIVRAFVQARMSSNRFPGKVLAPLRGQPVLRHLVDRVAQVLPRDRIVVLTSVDPTDDPVAAYAQQLGVMAFRGDLTDVFSRFQTCARAHPSDWFLRLCADSPMLEPAVIRAILDHGRAPEADVVTNVFPRTFPRGQSVEMIRTAAFLAIDPASLTAEQKEHVTKVFYDHAAEFRIHNLSSGKLDHSPAHFTVDTLEDLRNLEVRLAAGEHFEWPGPRLT